MEAMDNLMQKSFIGIGFTGATMPAIADVPLQDLNAC
jgi:hypothetical protein